MSLDQIEKKLTTWCLAEVFSYVEHELNGGSEIWLAVPGDHVSNIQAR